MVLLLVLMCADALVATVRPWPTKLILDYVLVGQTIPATASWLRSLPGVSTGETVSRAALLAWLATLPIGIFLIGQLVTSLSGLVGLHVGQRMQIGLRADLFERSEERRVGKECRTR